MPPDRADQPCRARAPAYVVRRIRTDDTGLVAAARDPRDTTARQFARAVTTAGTSAISNWTVTWTFAGGQSVAQAWNATVTSQGSAVTARNVAYNGALGAGASTAFGFLGSSSGTPSTPALTCTAS